KVGLANIDIGLDDAGPSAVTSHDVEAYIGQAGEIQFDPAAAVNNDANTIQLAAPRDAFGLMPGDAVQYVNGGGKDIGNLVNNQTYFVSFAPADPTKVRLHASAADALAGANIIDLDPTAAAGKQHRLIRAPGTINVGGPIQVHATSTSNQATAEKID